MENRISFIITNFNTKKYTEWCYNSIRKNLGYVHEIVMLDDGSEDGTWDLLQDLQSKDKNMIIHRNEENIGIAYSYNKMVELASNEIVCMLHSDMYVPPNFDKIMLSYMDKYDFITPLRVEPNVGYPESVDKFLLDFGTKSEEFEENNFIKWSEQNAETNQGRTEQRMFFPWMTTKKLYNDVGGNDELFSKYMVDDDDFYLRIKMATDKYCQLFETAVYHMPSKSVRMREDGKVEINSQYNKSIRNFIRKWGVHPSSVWDDNRDMILPKKYDIGFVVRNCTEDLLKFLEPWCSTIYLSDAKMILNYSLEESNLTLYNMGKRVKKINFDEDGNVTEPSKLTNDILIQFDAIELNDDRVAFLQRLSDILTDSGAVGGMEYDVFKLSIKNLGWKSYEER